MADSNVRIETIEQTSKEYIEVTVELTATGLQQHVTAKLVLKDQLDSGSTRRILQEFDTILKGWSASVQAKIKAGM